MDQTKPPISRRGDANSRVISLIKRRAERCELVIWENRAGVQMVHL